MKLKTIVRLNLLLIILHAIPAHAMVTRILASGRLLATPASQSLFFPASSRSMSMHPEVGSLRRFSLSSACNLSLSLQDDKKRTPLHYAAENGNLELVKLLIDRGAPLLDDSWGVTPLYFACLKGHLEVAKELFRSGSAINSRTALTRRTPLHAAHMSGNKELIHFLMLNGADARTKDAYGKAPDDY